MIPKLYMMKLKAYKINTNKISEPWYYSEYIVHAENRNQARKLLLNEVQYNITFLDNDEDVNYLNIPVIRSKKDDLILFENEYLSQYNINKILKNRERISELNVISSNPLISFCYIMKRGDYYRENCRGYTSNKTDAGIYTKNDAISQAKSCDELTIIPINSDTHNQTILEKIEKLQTKIINK